LFGNPYIIGKDGNREEVIEKYREYFLKRIDEDPIFKANVIGLSGKTLACFCYPKSCHGDVIIEWLNKTIKTVE